MIHVDVGDGVQQAVDAIREVVHAGAGAGHVLLVPLLVELLRRQSGRRRSPEACPTFEAGDHEVDDLVVVALLLDVAAHGAKRLVEDRDEHVDDDEGDGNDEHENGDLCQSGETKAGT